MSGRQIMWQTLRLPGVALTLTLALLARLPGSALGLVLLLQVRDLDGSYALAGVVSGAFALGMAGGGVVQARIVDRIGQPLVLLTAGACVAALQVAITQVPASHVGLLVPLALGAGATYPPVMACVRAIWMEKLPPRERNVVFSLEASLQELVYIAGPLIFVSLATLLSPATALLVLGAVLLATTAAFALGPDSRATRGRARPAHAAESPLRHANVRVLLGLMVVLGVYFGVVEIGVVAFAEHDGAEGAVGLLYGAWAAGGLVGGLVAAARTHDGDPARETVLLMVGLAVSTLLLALAPTSEVLTPALVVSGAVTAPLLARLYRLTGDAAPAGAATETYAWTTAGIMGGLAAGAAGAGAVAAAVHPVATFVLGTLVIAGAVAVLLPRTGSLTPCTEGGRERW